MILKYIVVNNNNNNYYYYYCKSKIVYTKYIHQNNVLSLKIYFHTNTHSIQKKIQLSNYKINKYHQYILQQTHHHASHKSTGPTGSITLIKKNYTMKYKINIKLIKSIKLIKKK